MMNYKWQEFNIKTFPAETIVYRNGTFEPELSTINSLDINKKYDLPVHIIFIGEITGKFDLNIKISAENQGVFLTVKLTNKKPAFLNIFVENTGKNSFFKGKVIVDNFSKFNLNNRAVHKSANTEIVIQTKILGQENSESILSGSAIIEKYCDNTTSDISFAAIMKKDAKIELMPKQYISAVPNSAEHSASIYKPNAPQIQYLLESGLDARATNKLLCEAFLESSELF